MATITIKNIPDELYEALKKQAGRNHRSINGEVIFLIERAVHQPQTRTVEEILARAAALRERATGIYLTDDELEAAINEGRE